MMKRFFSFAAVIALLVAAVSCEKDNFNASEQVQLSVVVPAQPATRAQMSDGTTADELVYEVYVGSEVMYEGVVGAASELTDKGYRQFVLNLQLVKGQSYDILFWAQNEGTGFYNTTSLKEVSTTYTGAFANDETRDAFYGSLLAYDVAQGNKTVELTRPFAQLNCAVTPADWTAVAPFITNGLQSAYSLSEVHTHFNVATGDVITGKTAQNVVMDYALAPVSETVYSNDIISYQSVDYSWVAMGYFFAPANGSNLNLTASFVHDKNTVATAISVPVASVPVKRNYKTNILGEMLSANNALTIVVVPAFVNEDNDNPDFIIK